MLSGCNSSNNDSNAKNISGSAIKGVISKGIIKAYSFQSQEKQLISETRTDQLGEFSLTLPNGITSSSPLLLELSVDKDTKMRCDLTIGCVNQNTGRLVGFGEDLELPANFKLFGIATTYQTNSNTYITPLSHLIVTTALTINANLNYESIITATTWVNNALKLSLSPILTEPKDITEFENYSLMNKEQLKQSILSAAIYPETLGLDWSLGATTIDSIDLKDVLTRAAELAGDLSELIEKNNPGQATTLSRIQSDTEAQLVSLNTSDIVILSQPTSVQTTEGNAINLFVQANSDLELSYQWYKNTNPIIGANSAIYSKASSSIDDSGLYYVVISNTKTELSSLSASVTVNQAEQVLQITQQPKSQSLTEGDFLELSVNAIGDGSLTYQWQKNGSIIPGAISSRYTISSILKNHEGSYRVTVSNETKQLASNFVNVWVTQPVTPVSILSQPQDQTVTQGNTISLSVSANGGGFISYQWRKNGIPINNAFLPNFSIENADTLDEGSYDVIVSNSQGSIVSNSASIRVLSATVPIMILTQPQSQTIESGNIASFHVSATGGSPLIYQWFYNGNAINGAQASRYDIPSVDFGNQGIYSVLISNGNSSEQSDSAYLTVSTPQITSIELSWDTPTHREDGSELLFNEISGYVIEYGYGVASLNNRIQVDNQLPHSAILEELESGTIYLRIATIDSDNIQGAFSNIISINIP